MILEVKNLCKNYGANRVLDDVSLQIYPGEILGIIGGKGSGKTTILKSIIGITPIDSGEITYESPFLPESKKIGYLPQEKPLYEKMTVKNQLMLFYGINSDGLGGAYKRIRELLEEYDIEKYANTRIRNLPREIRKKVELITSVLHNPSLLILDEPFAGVDYSIRNIIKEKLIELNNRGVTIVFTSTKVGELDNLCDRLIFLKEGKITEEGTVEKLKKIYMPDNSMRIRTSKNIKPIFQKVGITGKEIEYLDYQFTYKDSEQLFNLNKEIVNSKIQILEMKKIEKTLGEVFEKEMEA